MSRTRETIAAAFAALERAADENGLEACALFRKAYDAALDPAKITDARSAAAVRLDCLYASALRQELIGRMGADFTDLRARLEGVAAIDYATEIAK